MSVEQVAATRGQEWADENGALIIDVREPHEWAMGTFPGAELIRLQDLPGRLGDLDQDRATLIVCRTGNRSNAAAAFMVRRLIPFFCPMPHDGGAGDVGTGPENGHYL